MDYCDVLGLIGIFTVKIFQFFNCRLVKVASVIILIYTTLIYEDSLKCT